MVFGALLGCSTDAFTLFGVVCAAYLGYTTLSSLLNGFKTFFLARGLRLSAILTEMGSWAVVTGCTDGIGKAYAEQLAQQGLNIVLISRTPEKLQKVSRDIESKFKVKTKIVVADFSTPEIYPGIRSQLEGLNIGVLVNNVGISYPCPGRLLELEHREKFFMNLIHANIVSMVMMTSIVLPGMLERKKGAVINLASISALRPTPLLTIYSASKVFADFFTIGLQKEYEDRGIIIQSVLPGYVATKLSRINKASLLIPFPDTYVRSALATVGVADKTFGYWSHAVLAWFLQLLPDFLHFKFIFKAVESIRVTYMRRKERESKAQ